MWIVTNHEENGLDCLSELTLRCSFVTSDVMLYCNILLLGRGFVGARADRE
jgi:hypothetical protein